MLWSFREFYRGVLEVIEWKGLVVKRYEFEFCFFMIVRIVLILFLEFSIKIFKISFKIIVVEN